MSSNLQYGYPPVPKSITNANVYANDALDLNSPMSFLVFIKTITVNFDPEVLQTYYTEYLKRWNLKKNNQQVDDDALIVEKYREFIKDITLKYTTIEEQEYLKKIDFNDPYDLDTVLGLYSKKLIDIATYYNSKRDDVKYELTRKKAIGSVAGLEKTIFEKTISFLDNRDTSLIDYDIEEIKTKLKIDVSELYNVYSNYYNQVPNEQIYDNKDLDYGADIFLKDNASLISTIFAGVSDELKNLKEVDQLFDNKRQLTKQSMGVDFYYLSTGPTTSEFVSGLLFEADNKAKSLLNRNYPTIPATLQGTLIDTYEMGFFKTSKTSIVLVDGKNQSFQFNIDKLEPNSIYYFPDPHVFGGNADIITFYVNDEYLKRNLTSSNAVNKPISNKNDTKYYGYVTEKLNKFDCNLESIFDSGFVQDQKEDVYGNIYGLFKNDINFVKGIKVVEPKTIKSLELNGYRFYDDIFDEGYAFNFTTRNLSSFTELKRSGLSACTSTFSGASALSGVDTFFFRYFAPYDELKAPTEDVIINDVVMRDGGFFTKTSGAPFADPISSDNPSYPGAGQYYYSLLMECGLSSYSPLIRPIGLNAADFTQNAQHTRTNGIISNDCGYFNDPFNFNYKLPTISYYYDDTVLVNSEYAVDQTGNTSYNERYDLNGNIFIKNMATQTVNDLTSEFYYLSSRYTPSAYRQLSAISKFEINSDTLFIETDNYLVFEKINYEDSKFNPPVAVVYEIQHNASALNKLSNRFKVGSDVYYCVLQTTTSAISSNNYLLYPEIYKFDTLSHRNHKIFPITPSDYLNHTDFFSVSGGDVRFTRSEKPTITYAKKNDIFNISFLLKDQNDMVALHEYDFRLTPDVQFLKHNVYFGTFESYSNIMNANYNSTVGVYLSATPVTSINEEIIV